MIETSMAWNRHTRFADNPGEHNARLLALRNQAAFEKNAIARLDLAMCDYARYDAFGGFHFDFQGKAKVREIHAKLAREYAAKHAVPMFRAFEATGHTAFQQWDALQAQGVAA